VKLIGKSYSNDPGGPGPLNFISSNRLMVMFPEKGPEGLRLGKPIFITDRAMGVTSHAGSLDMSVTIGKKTFVAFGELPDDLLFGGNPQMIAEIDRESGVLIQKKLVIKAFPECADGHSLPSIGVDSKNVLQYISGAHAWRVEHPGFFYAHALAPGSASEWSAPEMLWPGQSYDAVALGQKDSLHIFMRIHPNLCYQKKEGANAKWTAPIALAGLADWKGTYTGYFQQAFADRKRNIYLQFSFVDNAVNAERDFPHVIATSDDQGKSWKLATTDLFQRNVLP